MDQTQTNNANALRCGLWLFQLLLLAGLFLNCAIFAGDDAKPDPEKILKQLDDADFDTRKAIEKQIEDLGEAARTALEKASRNGSFETRQVAARLLGLLSNASLTLEIRDAMGGPLKGAELEVQTFWGLDVAPADFSPAPKELKTDDQGQANVSGLMPGPYTVKLKINGYHALNAGWGSIDADYALILASGANRLVHRVQPNLQFQARIETQAGEALRDATVVLAQMFVRPRTNKQEEESEKWGGEADQDGGLAAVMLEAEGGLKGLSDAQGRVSISAVPEGLYEVTVQHADFRTRHAGYVVLRPNLPPPELVVVRLNKSSPRKNTLAVKFMDAKGEPLASKEMYVLVRPVLSDAARAAAISAAKAQLKENQFEPVPSEQWRVIQTSDTGEFELKDVAAGTYSVLAHDEEGEQTYFAPAAISTPPPEAGKESAAFVLRPSPLCSLNGRVVILKGEGLSELGVVALPEGDVMAALFVDNPELVENYIYSLTENVESISTDQNGRFAIKNLSPGKYVILVHNDARILSIVHPVEAKLNEAVEVPEIGVHAPRGGSWRVTGKVRGVDGKPIASATVYVMDRTGSIATGNSSEDGSYELVMAGLQPEVLGASAPGFKGHTVQPPRGMDAQMDLMLHKAVNGSLRVNVSGDSTQASRLRVLRMQDTPDGVAESVIPVSPKGVAQQRNMIPGRYKIIAQDDTFSGEASAEVEIIGGQETRVDLKMPASSRIEGSVKFTGGELPAGIQISFVRSDQNAGDSSPANQYRRYIQPRADGTFTSPPLAQGTYTFTIEGPGLADQRETTLKLEPAQTAKLDLVVQPACSLRVDCGPTRKFVSIHVGPTGHWKSGPTGNDVLKNDGPDFFLQADARGIAECKRLAPGAYDVVIDAGDDESSRFVRSVRIEAAHQKTPLLLQVAPVENPAAVVGQLKLDLNALRQLRFGQQSGSVAVQLSLEADDHIATHDFELPGELSRSAIELIRVGPNGEMQKTTNAASFEINALKPGTYRAKWLLRWTDRENEAWNMAYEPLQHRQLPAEIILKPGEKKDLGLLEVELPTTVIERVLSAQRKYMEWIMLENMAQQGVQDGEPAFQP